ncbi:MAG TPA: L,D-transpeptidase [Candidatus Binatia bacterium]|nr:L,D-transpeptidase [Candidatus Binatia bacterium]
MKRAVAIISLVLAAGLVAGGTLAVLVDSHRRSSFAAAAASLQRAWARDLAAGVPEASIDPLQKQLQTQRPQQDWWAPVWLTSDGTPIIDRLRQATIAAYSAAMDAQRAKAQVVLSAWEQQAGTDQTWIPASEITARQSWPAQLSAASTPNQVQALTASWQKQLDTTRAEVLAAQQQAKIQADIAAVGGPSGLITEAQTAISRASSDDLDPGDVADLLQQLEGEVLAGAAVSDTAEQLYAALEQLNELFSINDQLYSEMRPIELIADQAAAEGTPNSASLLTQYRALDQAFLNGTTYDELNPLLATAATLQSDIQTELSANQCGHDVGPGKVITINLTLQEGVFYQDGCVVNATPVTTGRPGLRTPAGRFSVFFKTSPFTMVSPWPPGSPYWYPTTTVTWVMEFDGGGYFIHDAYWEPNGDYGPGSENNVGADAASHGCIHIPTPMMRWLYGWTPLGAPVIITN